MYMITICSVFFLSLHNCVCSQKEWNESGMSEQNAGQKASNLQIVWLHFSLAHDSVSHFLLYYLLKKGENANKMH